ncbi:preprotein translocase subunit SecY [Variibacter gotjawalensis]|uniref:preprotein translocase subunit SecY n=1 Tax=Variibacter gotjawalensis TaxID=1333996 RepID=UPI0012FDEFA8|nr:hypothetical protein [Variibacter gotjawalensis]NIK46870.1 preprotein translocase subunit SecY [Variibacter gotjawalensis]
MIQRIGFTIGALLLYRLGCNIPIPGIDPVAWQSLFGGLQGVANAGNFFGGNASARISLFALTIIPYITAAFFIQFVVLASRRVRARAEDSGVAGRRMIVRVTLALTLLLAAFQAIGLANAMQQVTGLVTWQGPAFIVTATIIWCAGVLALVWLAEQITARGFGNGISWLLFATAAAELPTALATSIEMVRLGVLSGRTAFLLLLVVVAIVAWVVMVELARRNFSVERIDGKGRADLNLKLNPSGIAPQLLAGWAMLVPVSLLPWVWQFVSQEQAVAIVQAMRPGSAIYYVCLALCLIVTSVIYTAFLLDPARLAERLRVLGLSLPGVAPGEPTADAFDHSVSRLSLAGALYLVLVIVGTQVFFASLGLPFAIGGFALLVVVSTVLDLRAQYASYSGGERL